MFTCLINIRNANYSLSAAQIYCELSVGTPLSTCYHRLTCINMSLDSCLLETDRIQLLVFISVDVRLQYFMEYSISLNINLIQLPQCCSLFWQYKRKWLLYQGLCVCVCVCVCRKWTFAVHLSKKVAALCWKWERPTNHILQLVEMSSFTHYESSLPQLSRSAVFFIHSKTF